MKYENLEQAISRAKETALLHTSYHVNVEDDKKGYRTPYGT